MLTFTEEQIQAFQAARFDAFLEKLAIRQLGRHPDTYVDVPTTDLSKVLAPIISRGRKLGFFSTKHMNQWADFAAVLGETFDSQPWVARILKAGHPPDRALDLISREAVFHIGKA